MSAALNVTKPAERTGLLPEPAGNSLRESCLQAKSVSASVLPVAHENASRRMGRFPLPKIGFAPPG
jgi:hypothetical protein